MTIEQLTKDHSRGWLLFARFLLIITICLWMYVIFSFSSQNATESTQASDKAIAVLDKVIEVTTGHEVKLEFNQEYRQFVEFGIRKCAHMFIYFILCITIMLFLFTFPKIPMLIRMLLAVFSCFLYACSDEFHQSFVAGRGPSFRDVIIDTTGAFLGIFASLMIYCVIYTIYHKHEMKKISKYNKDLDKKTSKHAL